MHATTQLAIFSERFLILVRAWSLHAQGKMRTIPGMHCIACFMAARLPPLYGTLTLRGLLLQ
jgi:hypothetical protein